MSTSDRPGDPSGRRKPSSPDAKAKLADALRDNLRRRKDQARARASTAAEDEPVDKSAKDGGEAR